MSANRFAQAGPIMQGIAAMGEFKFYNGYEKLVVEPELSNSDIVRMIQNVADQLSEVAAQLVEVRQRLDALEKPKQASPFGSAIPNLYQNALQQNANLGQMMAQCYGKTTAAELLANRLDASKTGY